MRFFFFFFWKKRQSFSGNPSLIPSNMEFELGYIALYLSKTRTGGIRVVKEVLGVLDILSSKIRIRSSQDRHDIYIPYLSFFPN